jgi:hypothetical protein
MTTVGLLVLSTLTSSMGPVLRNQRRGKPLRLLNSRRLPSLLRVCAGHCCPSPPPVDCGAHL